LLYRALIARDGFDLSFVLELWAVGAVLCTVALGVLFVRLNSAEAKGSAFDFHADILSQHKSSLTHFLIGLIAVLILQFDRLAVGGLMGFEQTGLYFRHTLLVSFAYQAFSIASFNRITPTIFAEAKTQGIPHLLGRVMREYRKTLIAVPTLLACIWAADWITAGVWSGRFQLSLLLMALLMAAFTLRTAADFHGLILNARHDERHILRSQGAAFVVGAGLLVLLTLGFGVFGTAVAAIATSGLYLVLVSRAVRGIKT
jgi:O-antigen/teichoic acid export membrane protein